MSTPKRTAHYVASTHWDREWYEPFQHYRFRLVRLMDEVLDLMKTDPEFRCFHTDGQSIMVEDYLEARPRREAEFRELARAGRILVGPWYVMPDEFIVSGESLIRNLQLGLVAAGRYGRPARVGFVCDMFGHISQLPQILRGFGIDNAFLFRGTNDRTHGAIWRWQGADGSEVIVNRFPRVHGYTGYAFHVRKVMALDEPFEMDQAVEALLAMVDVEKQRHRTPSFLLFDGSDHIEIEPATSELLRRANERLKDVEIVHSNLEAFIADIRGQAEHITETSRGELRDPAEMGDDALLLAGTLSSRMYLKQANARCENELGLWAEPFAAFAGDSGSPYPQEFLHLAWRYLITNHAHDSICGCSVDAVHEDMMYRFRQSLQISEHVTGDALRHIALRAERPNLDGQDFAVVVFNPASEAVDGPVDLTLRFPAGIDALFEEGFGYEPRIGFRLYDVHGAELPYQLVNQRWNRRGRRRPLRKFPGPDDRHEVDVAVHLQVPSHGYTTLACRPAARAQPTRYSGSMLVDHRTMENEYLQVRAAPNGTLSMLDKRTQQQYDELLTFEDCADIGDGWYHGRPVNDEWFNSSACTADVAVVADGPLKTTLRIALAMNLPEQFRFDRMIRSARTSALRITICATLRRGARHVEVQVVVENTIRDHRLRVLCPTGTRAATYFADSAFDVIERPIHLRPDNASYREMEVECRPQHTWTAVYDPPPARRGLAIVSTGLPESAVCDHPGRPIALTLLRSFIKAYLTDGQEGGEMQGTHEFACLIVPLDGTLPRTWLCRLGQQLAAPPRPVQVEARDLIGAAPPGLPASQSFLRLSPGQAIITAIHRGDEGAGLIVRMFNPLDAAVTETLCLGRRVSSAERTDLEGNVIETVTVEDGRIKAPLGPRQIVTLRIV